MYFWTSFINFFVSRGLTKHSVFFFANSSYENLIFESPVLSRHQSAMTFFVGLSSSLPPLPTPSNQIRNTDLRAGVRFKDPLPLPSKQRRLITAMKGPPRRGIIGVMAPPMNPRRGPRDSKFVHRMPARVKTHTVYGGGMHHLKLSGLQQHYNPGGATSGAV